MPIRTRQVSFLRNREPLKALNDTKLILNDQGGSIWYRSEHSEDPYHTNKKTGRALHSILTGL